MSKTPNPRTSQFLVRLVLIGTMAMVFAFVSSCSDDSVAPDPDPDPQPTAKIETWAGNGLAAWDGDNNPLLESSFYQPIDVTFTPSHGTYIMDWNNHRIRKVTDEGTLETVIGTNIIGDGPPDFSDLTEPGAPGTEVRLNHPTKLIELNDGRLLLTAWHNHKLRRYDPATGLVYVVAGGPAGFGGDGGHYHDALLNQPQQTIQAPDGTLYILDQRNQVVRRVDPATENISTVVGTPAEVIDGIPQEGGYSGDNGPPLGCEINLPTGPNPAPGGAICMDDQGRLYIADTNNNRIRRCDFDQNIITTVVGTGVAGYSGDGGDPRQAQLDWPLDIEFGPDGRLYIADEFNNVIRAVDFDKNVITTVAGNGEEGFSGDGGDPKKARLSGPRGIAFDQDGYLYIIDTGNHRIRRIDTPFGG